MTLRPPEGPGSTGNRRAGTGHLAGFDAQAEDADRIRTLRFLEMPLAEIRAILAGDPTTTRAMLEAHRRRLAEAAEKQRRPRHSRRIRTPGGEPAGRSRSCGERLFVALRGALQGCLGGREARHGNPER